MFNYCATRCVVEDGNIEIVDNVLDVTTETKDEIVETTEHELGVTAEIEDEIVETTKHVLDVIAEAKEHMIPEAAKHMMEVREIESEEDIVL